MLVLVCEVRVRVGTVYLVGLVNGYSEHEQLSSKIAVLVSLLRYDFKLG